MHTDFYTGKQARCLKRRVINKLKTTFDCHKKSIFSLIIGKSTCYILLSKLFSGSWLDIFKTLTFTRFDSLTLKLICILSSHVQHRRIFKITR